MTFNIQQQELILNLFDDARRSNSKLEWFFSDEREEPVIVKNLENIQGDERDIMCFSITFGRDKAGKLSMHFGALNLDGGEKRLNVAITRARSEMHVFSSVVADDIDTARTRAIGVAHLKNFLDYAHRGPIALPAMDEGSLGDVESPFEEAVLRALRNRGWELRPQVGVSGFRIDLGVVHPDHAGAYLAGIECDGATYHSSASARDRDKIREAVLCNLGWSIIRIWSTDWFMNPQEALQRVLDALTDLLEESREQDKAKKEAEEAKKINEKDKDWKEVPEELVAAQIIQESSTPEAVQTVHAAQLSPLPDEASDGTSYPQDFEAVILRSTDTLSQTDSPDEDGQEDNFDWPCEPDASRFFDPGYMPTISQMVTRLVEHEGPIETNRLARIICKAHGWQRTGAKIRNQIDACLGKNELRKEGKTTFIWVPGGYNEQVSFREGLNRSILEISRHEMFGLIDAHPELVMSDDRVRDLSNIMGIQRLSKTAKSYIVNCLSLYYMRQ